MKPVLLHRAMQWFKGDIPVSSIQARLVGADEPCRFHTVAFLFMLEGTCEILGARDVPPDKVLSLERVQQRIQDLEVPTEKLDIQRTIMSEHLLEQVDPQLRLAAAAYSASVMLRLPIAFLAFGNVLRDDGELIFLQAMIGAPLDLVLEHFKKFTP